MRISTFLTSLLTTGLMGAVGIVVSLGLGWDRQPDDVTTAVPTPAAVPMEFLVLAGGGAPSYNEIALEKNVRYFQRTLGNLGIGLDSVRQYFANGNNGDATVRFVNFLGREQFKPPEIDSLNGPATADNAQAWFEGLANKSSPCPAFFYFTGHGAYNRNNPDNNSMILWEEQFVSVQKLTGWLDQLPAERPFVAMMAQCFSGSFANLIYEQGNPENPVALQSRCGFFATVARRPSVGCTPAVNEADYRDYSSSFFAGLSGIDRTGEAVESADYNADGTVSYAEAHAFAKVDEETTDWPVSTVEVWLQKQADQDAIAEILAESMADLISQAEPHRQYVVSSLSDRLSLDLNRSYASQMPPLDFDSVTGAYWVRLGMELINIVMIQQIQQGDQAASKLVLEQIATCENGSLPIPQS